jgi:hypothetical protein
MKQWIGNFGLLLALRDYDARSYGAGWVVRVVHGYLSPAVAPVWVLMLALTLRDASGPHCTRFLRTSFRLPMPPRDNSRGAGIP